MVCEIGDWFMFMPPTLAGVKKREKKAGHGHDLSDWLGPGQVICDHGAPPDPYCGCSLHAAPGEKQTRYFALSAFFFSASRGNHAALHRETATGVWEYITPHQNEKLSFTTSAVCRGLRWLKYEFRLQIWTLVVVLPPGQLAELCAVELGPDEAPRIESDIKVPRVRSRF